METFSREVKWASLGLLLLLEFIFWLLGAYKKPPGGTLLQKANVLKEDRWFLQLAFDNQSFAPAHLEQCAKDHWAFIGNKSASSRVIKLYGLKRQIVGCLRQLLSHLDFSIPGYSFEISLIKTFAVEITKVMNWQACHILQKSPQICSRMFCTRVSVML